MRAGLVREPKEYRWSSAGRADPVVTHPAARSDFLDWPTLIGEHGQRNLAWTAWKSVTWKHFVFIRFP